MLIFRKGTTSKELLGSQLEAPQPNKIPCLKQCVFDIFEFEYFEHVREIPTKVHQHLAEK